MRKRFLVLATVASMALGTMVAPAFAADDTAAPTTTRLNCTASVLGHTFTYPVTIQGALPTITNTTFTRNGVTVTIDASGKITVNFGAFSASASCTVA